MATVLALAFFAAPLHAATLTATSLDAGGARAASSSYVNDGSLGGIVGISSGASDVAKNGYVGQLTEMTNLAVTATPPSVPETNTAQMGSLALLDDGTVTAVSGTNTTWSAVSFPLASLSVNGLATTLAVYTNTAATVTGTYLGVTGSGALLVLDTSPDNFGSYAGDGLPDSWQAGYFGLGNTNAAPGLDLDGDGFNNRGEYIADTVPTNPLSYFHIVAQYRLSSTNRVLVDSSAIRTYALDAATNLATGPWNPVSGQTNVPGTGLTISLADTNTAAAHYRVRVLAPD